MNDEKNNNRGMSQVTQQKENGESVFIEEYRAEDDSSDNLKAETDMLKIEADTPKASTDIEKLKALYDAADDIYSLELWDIFCGVDLAEIYLKGDLEPYYCSITGMFEDVKGISVYAGNNGLVSLSNFINAIELPEYIMMSQKNCLECTWGSRSDLRKRDLDAVKGSGHKYRGAEAWPLFRKFETGYEPWFFDADDVEIFVEVLRELTAAVRELKENGELSNMNEGDRIRRRFDEEKNEWVSECLAPIEKIEAVADGCVITDELLIRRLKKKPVIDTIIEFDMPFLPMPVKGKTSGERPFYPRMSIICDTEKISMEDSYFIDRFDDPNDVALGMLINYIEQNGRPASVYVRSPEIFGIAAHLCKSIDVDIFLTSNLHVLDYFVEDFLFSVTNR